MTREPVAFLRVANDHDAQRVMCLTTVEAPDPVLGFRIVPPPAAAVQGEQDQERLEEQPDESLAVGVEAEGVGALDVLGDIAGEDRHEERREQSGDEPLPPGQCDEGRAQRDLDDARREHDQVLVPWEPVGHQGLELHPQDRQVQHSCAHHRRAEHETHGGAGEGGHVGTVAGRAARPAVVRLTTRA